MRNINLHEGYTKQSLEQGGHWLWTAWIDPKGYGVYSMGSGGKQMKAHRAVYESLVGPIPVDLYIDHKCGVRRCVNPAHLEVVTITSNNRRRNNNKLTMEKAREIRHLYFKGPAISLKDLGRQYGVSERLIWNIVNRKAWLEGKELQNV